MQCFQLPDEYVFVTLLCLIPKATRDLLLYRSRLPFIPPPSAAPVQLVSFSIILPALATLVSQLCDMGIADIFTLQPQIVCQRGRPMWK